MKILHTADWHLGKKLDRFDRLEEQKKVLDEICTITEQNDIDVVLIAGDLYDTFSPPNEAIELFYKTLKRLSNDGRRPVIAIAGNHDSADRIEAPDPLARECGILLSGYPDTKIQTFELETGVKLIRADHGFVELSLPNIDFPLRIILTPYANEVRLKKDLGTDDPESTLRSLLAEHWKSLANTYCDTQGVNLLMSHLFMVKKGGEIPEEPDAERPINVGGAQTVYADDIPPSIQYTALGHLHRYQTVDDRFGKVVYSGSPLAYSFAETEHKKGVVIVEVTPDQPADMTQIPLLQGHSLVRKTFDDIDKAENWLLEHPDTIVELSIETPTFLQAVDRKRLLQAHPRVIGPIPILPSDTANSTRSDTMEIDLKLGREELFVQYFKSKKNGIEPNDRLIALFRELTGKETSL